jgi:hypothetical protein
MTNERKDGVVNIVGDSAVVSGGLIQGHTIGDLRFGTDGTVQVGGHTVEPGTDLDSNEVLAALDAAAAGATGERAAGLREAIAIVTGLILG